MPLIDVRLLRGVFSSEERQQLAAPSLTVWATIGPRFRLIWLCG